ncbi:putative ABC-type amino acid transport/signal transduction systems, periplasmic component/domain [Candidatus Terasakiella magnetica]|uniref:Putative ABC-type amino acid transport/signal transduction systems, periplasmic component/domain n=1 Tax=Candidatus Terasakiella magnetica TaxID=1867952 RepID=A0A1C3RCZ7_9PROT|nr:transporter substrate-binding domain-containing protein [Candidatus Terasakiella magnetica]SCA55143.1 putative ABC-type amino acid transport/signal transduction systems, periplasmic component/domain [Candidatus Terasakiella magnetica]
MKKYLSLLAFILFSFNAQANSSLMIMTEEFAPYQFYEENDGTRQFKGISLEVVQALQKEVGNQDPIKVLPWNRALKLLAKKKNALLFSTARTPERENKYKWVGPLASLEMVFFKRSDSDISLNSLDEARTLNKIGVTKNVATHEILRNMGFTNLDVMESGADEKNLKRLIKKRVDVWPTVYYAGTYSAKKMGVLEKIQAIPNVKIMSGHLYIAFNKAVDDKIIHQWQLALDSLRTKGVIDQIVMKYEK